MTMLYSLAHLLVDGICAWAMLGTFGGRGILLYNFCAFVLQLPLGAVLDRLGGSRGSVIFARLGCVLTVLGALVHPALLGLGNALFHVGGGVAVIRDTGRCADLGVFVAPGALGLYLGGLLRGRPILLPMALALATAAVFFRGRESGIPPASGKGGVMAAVCCFAVVVLRSFVGFRVVFPWRTGWLALAAVGAVVLGKMAGGWLAARFGARAVTVCSLTAAAVCYGLGNIPALGLLALLCFNMTMPLTLYALWRRFPGYPGAAFGALTLALFLGFVPIHFGLELPLGGVTGSLLSLILLWKAVEDA